MSLEKKTYWHELYILIDHFRFNFNHTRGIKYIKQFLKYKTKTNFFFNRIQSEIIRILPNQLNFD